MNVHSVGRQVVPPQYEGIDYSAGFRGGLCLVQRDKKWGFIDRTGAVVIPIKYWEATGFSEGLARVAEKNDETTLVLLRNLIRLAKYIYPGRRTITTLCAQREPSWGGVGDLPPLLCERIASVVRGLFRT